jgi:hypothetical protein
MEDLLAEISDLHRQVHREDPPPASEAEHQAATVMARLLRSILGFAKDGLAPRLIEGALFYQWLRWTTWNHGLDESTFEAWSDQMESKAAQMIRLLNGVAARDREPNPDMRRLSAKIQKVKDAYGVIAQSKPLSRSEVEHQADLRPTESTVSSSVCLEIAQNSRCILASWNPRCSTTGYAYRRYTPMRRRTSSQSSRETGQT